MGIVAQETVYGADQANGFKQFKHKLTDHLGVVHITASRNVAPDFDVPANLTKAVIQKDLELIAREASQYESSLSDEMAPTFQTKLQAQKTALETILRKDNLCDVLPLLGSIAFIKSKTDAQIKSVLNFTDAQVLKLRDWQAEMELVHEINKNYEALI